MISFIQFGSHWLFAFGFHVILISVVQRLPVLTTKGWFHAGALGTILYGCLGWNAWLAVVFYLVLGYLVTKIGFAKKQALGIAERRGGRRGPENVWGSAATGAIIAIFIKLGFGSHELLLLGFSASFAAKLADTFGSEIGKRWGTKTFLITTLRAVPAGTDGGISLEGTIASVFGSVLMTLVFSSLGLIGNSFYATIVICSGVVATLSESFVGAVFQNRLTWMSNELVNFFQTSFAALITVFGAYIFN
tara:strand:+ start:107 stop:850 length:744 start_codon:yes stop_codon:yes gene_type:complete